MNLAELLIGKYFFVMLLYSVYPLNKVPWCHFWLRWLAEGVCLSRQVVPPSVIAVGGIRSRLIRAAWRNTGSVVQCGLQAEVPFDLLKKKHLCTFLRVNVIEQYGQQSNNSLNVYHLHGVYWHHASVCFVVSMFTILAYCTFSGENVQKKTSNSVQSKDILTHAQDHGKTPSPASQHICCSSLQQKEDLMGVSA